MKKETKKRIIWCIAATCLLLFITLTQLIFTKEIMEIDSKIYEFLKTNTNPCMTLIMKIITFLSNPTSLVCILIFLFFLWKEKKKWVGACLNLGGIIALNQLFKVIVKRIRPLSTGLLIEKGYSFPSGHAMVACAFFGFLTYLFLEEKKTNKTKALLLIFSMLLIGMISFSRLYLGVHYFSDVIAGFFFSCFYLYLFIKAYNNFKITENCIKLIHSFKYAFRGIYSAFKSERNMKIHLTILSFVLLFGILLKISMIEWIICIFCVALVIGSEMFNTSIETVVDLVTQEQNELAKLSKDIAAGAVLVSAIASSLIGLCIFLPKFIAILK